MLKRGKRISLKMRRELLKHFSAGIKAADVIRFFNGRKKADKKIDPNTVYSYFTHFREAIFIHQRKAPRLAGEVEIDETMFGGRARKKRLDNYGDPDYYTTQGFRDKKRKKYKKPPKILVIGILRRGGDVYTHIVPDRREASLIPVIHMVVEPGTTIYTDEWSSYAKLDLSGYNHIKINHSKKFVKRKGEHVNTLERFWQYAKDQIRPYKGGFRHNFPLHLKEAEFRWNVGEGNVLFELKKIVKI